MIQDAIIKIVQKEDLSYEESYAVMNEIMSGQTTPTQNAAFLAALSTKSTRAETIDEISGCAAAMRDHAIKFDANGLETLEIVGTGGDGAHSFNISTLEQAAKMAGIADGAIVGSAIIKLLEQYGKDAPEHIGAYVKSMKDAVREYTI